MDGGSGLGERREAVAAAYRALTGWGEVLWAAGSGELEAVMGEVDRLVALGEAARVEVDTLRDWVNREEIDTGQPTSVYNTNTH